MTDDDQIPTYMDQSSVYTDREIYEAIKELKGKLEADEQTIEEQLLDLITKHIPMEEAKESLLRNLPRSYNDVDAYERFDAWRSPSPPPKIDNGDWMDFIDSHSGLDIKKQGRELQSGSEYVVYCIECRTPSKPLWEVERDANLIFGEVPGWVKRAYRADFTFYIGQTARFGKRLGTHATGVMSDSPPPARLVCLFGMKAAGVITRISNRAKAEAIEQYYAENLDDVGHSRREVFVYYA